MLTKFKQCFTIDEYNSIVQTFIFSITLIVPSYLTISIIFTCRISICYQYIHHYSHKYHGSSCKMEHIEAHVSYRNTSLMYIQSYTCTKQTAVCSEGHSQQYFGLVCTCCFPTSSPNHMDSF